MKYDFWYDYIKPKYGEKAKLCYMDTGSFIVHIKNRKYLQGYCTSNSNSLHFNFSNYEIDRPLSMAKNKKETGLMKGTKKWVIKRDLKFQDYKKCLKACKIINTVNYLQKTVINVDSLKEDYRVDKK